MKEVINEYGQCVYYDKFIEEDSALFEALYTKINWSQDKIKIFGKTHSIPRFHAWYADSGCEYSYSNISLERNDWIEELQFIKLQVERFTKLRFNAVLANLYRDGKDSNGWHSDDETMLVRPIHVASVSLGQERIFQFKRKDQTRIDRSIVLGPGSLVVMKSPMQDYWHHKIPKTKRALSARINLTFRRVL